MVESTGIASRGSGSARLGGSRARIVFLGTPDAAVPSLDALVESGHDVVLVVSQADTKRGRGAALSPSPVKARALQLGLKVSDRLDDVFESGADLGVVVAYGKIIPKRVLDAVPMVNVHFSLLPRWRGAAPVERAILAGDEETGVCIMRVDAGLDTGPVLSRRVVRIGTDPPEHAAQLTARLSHIGAEMLVEVLKNGPSSLGPGEAQSGEPTYATKIDPSELRLDWTLPAEQLERVVRLDRAWTTFRGSRIRVRRARAQLGAGTESASSHFGSEPEAVGELRLLSVRELGSTKPTTVLGARCGSGWLRLEEVQPPGKRPMPGSEWAKGARLAPGERFQ